MYEVATVLKGVHFVDPFHYVLESHLHPREPFPFDNIRNRDLLFAYLLTEIS